jgi:hypothetical protein
MKWVRGDPDEYPNQIIAGLTLTTALALITSAELVRGRRTRWTLVSIGAIVLAISLAVVFSGIRVSPLTIIALSLCVGSIVTTAHAFRPARGVGLAEWRATPATLDQRRAACTGVATLNLGLAVFLVSQFDLARGPWQASAIAAFTTLMFLCAAMAFFVLRLRLRG